jgi:tetratricopeptide (TPR) repeat protein
VARERDAWIESRRSSARPLGARGGLSTDERERLQALGYVAGAANAQNADLAGADPKQRLAVLQALDRAETLGAARRWAEAYAVLEPFEESGALFLSVRASYAVNAGLFELGERDIRAALEAEPDRPDYLNILALARERRGDDGGASDLYHHLLEIDPNDASASTALGRLAEARRDQVEAERQYRLAIEHRPGSPEPIWRLAALRMEQGDLEIAGALLAEAPDPPDPVLALRVAAVEMDAGRTESASARLEKGLAKGDLPAPFAPAAAAILEAGGRLAAALRVYESALAAMPDSWQMKNGVAWCSTLLGRDLDRALELAQQASRASKGNPSVLDTLASVQLRRGEPKAALATAERGLARADAGTRPHLLFVRAAALRALGRRAEARRGVEAALADGGAGAASWRAEAAALARELGSDTSPPPSPP